jgi:predicted kinase
VTATPATKPTVVALMGLPGAGKSTVAAHLAARLALRRVDRDEIRAALFPRCDYSVLEKRAAFRSLLHALEVNCALGHSSVIDGMTFSRRRDVERVARTIEPFGARLLPVWLDVPAETARARIARDIASGVPHVAADRTPGLVDEVLQRLQLPDARVAVIDASKPVDQVGALVLKIVSGFVA